MNTTATIFGKIANGVCSLGLFAIGVQAMAIFNIALFKVIVKIAGA